MILGNLNLFYWEYSISTMSTGGLMPKRGLLLAKGFYFRPVSFGCEITHVLESELELRSQITSTR